MPEPTPWPKNIFASNEKELARAIGLRPEVLAFAKLMEDNLRKHDSDRGPRGWEDDGPRHLLRRLEEEYAELDEAVRNLYRNTSLATGLDPLYTADVAKEAADVANFAMMIADVVGGLEGE